LNRPIIFLNYFSLNLKHLKLLSFILEFIYFCSFHPHLTLLKSLEINHILNFHFQKLFYLHYLIYFLFYFCIIRKMDLSELFLLSILPNQNKSNWNSLNKLNDLSLVTFHFPMNLKTLLYLKILKNKMYSFFFVFFFKLLFFFF
jgi:hypothetical protein